jgi:hypothetical protein
MTIAEKNIMIVQFLNISPAHTGAYHLPQFGYKTDSCLWKDHFKPEELQFHKNWEWLMYVAKYANEKYTLELQLNTSEETEEVFERFIEMINTVNNYES